MLESKSKRVGLFRGGAFPADVQNSPAKITKPCECRSTIFPECFEPCSAIRQNASDIPEIRDLDRAQLPDRVYSSGSCREDVQDAAEWRRLSVRRARRWDHSDTHDLLKKISLREPDRIVPQRRISGGGRQELVALDPRGHAASLISGFDAQHFGIAADVDVACIGDLLWQGQHKLNRASVLNGFMDGKE